MAKASHGCTLTIGAVPIANLGKISYTPPKSDKIETPAHDISFMEYVDGGIKKGGALKFSLWLDKAQTGHSELIAAQEAGTSPTFVLTHPTAAHDAATFAAFVDIDSIDNPEEGATGAEISLMITGEVT